MEPLWEKQFAAIEGRLAKAQQSPRRGSFRGNARRFFKIQISKFCVPFDLQHECKLQDSVDLEDTLTGPDRHGPGGFKMWMMIK
jgi:hypothetical protein